MPRWLPVFLVALLIYFPGADAPFSNTAESQEGLVAWEMLASGDWVLPRVNGELIPSKPPLYHWLALGFAGLRGGLDELALRLPSIVGSAAAIAMVFAAGFRHWGVAAGAIAALALAASPEWAKWATTARTDATFVAFLTAGFLAGERWLATGRRGWLLTLAATTAAGPLAKGFAGAGLVGLTLAIEMWRRRAWNRLEPRGLAIAASLFIVIACSWYAGALAQAGFAFFHKQIVLENVLRFLPSEGGPSRKHSFYYYVPMLFVGFLPWSLALPTAIRRAFRERGHAVEGGFSGYLLVWCAVVFGICTAASGKRTNYLLPMYPALALLVGRQLSVLLEHAERGTAETALRRLGWVAAAVLGVSTALLAAWRLGLEPWALVIRWLHPQDRVLLPQMAVVLGPPHWLVILATAGATAAIAAATSRRSWRAVYFSAGAGLLFITITANAVVPVLEARLKSFAPFSSRVATAVGPGPLTFYQAADFAVLFYLRRHVPVERGDFESIPRPSWVLVPERQWLALPPSSKAGAEVVDASPPASIARPDTRLLLVRLSG